MPVRSSQRLSWWWLILPVAALYMASRNDLFGWLTAVFLVLIGVVLWDTDRKHPGGGAESVSAEERIGAPTVLFVLATAVETVAALIGLVGMGLHAGCENDCGDHSDLAVFLTVAGAVALIAAVVSWISSGKMIRQASTGVRLRVLLSTWLLTFLIPLGFGTLLVFGGAADEETEVALIGAAAIGVPFAMLAARHALLSHEGVLQPSRGNRMAGWIMVAIVFTGVVVSYVGSNDDSEIVVPAGPATRPVTPVDDVPPPREAMSELSAEQRSLARRFDWVGPFFTAANNEVMKGAQVIDFSEASHRALAAAAGPSGLPRGAVLKAGRHTTGYREETVLSVSYRGSQFIAHWGIEPGTQGHQYLACVGGPACGLYVPSQMTFVLDASTENDCRHLDRSPRNWCSYMHDANRAEAAPLYPPLLRQVKRLQRFRLTGR